MDLREIGTNLELDEDGIWVARTAHQISYPEEGNEVCFQIEDASYWFRHRNRCIVEIMRHFPPSGILFDIGGGNGFVAKGIGSAGFETVLVEPGDGARNALKRGLKTVVHATLEDAGFRSRSIDSAGAFDVMEHVDDDIGFLRHIHDMLKSGGRFYLTVPAFQALWSADDVRAGHFRRYTLRRLRDRFHQAKFEIEFATYFFAPLVIPVLLARAIPSRFGLRRPPSPDQVRSEHGTEGGLMVRAAQWLLDKEFVGLQRGASIPIGGSCLVVARAL